MGAHQHTLNIAYITTKDPRDKLAFSGITYYMAQALQKYCGQVQLFAPIDSFEKKYLGGFLNKTANFCFHKQIASSHLTIVARKHAKIVTELLADQTFDIIFAPIAAPEIALLKTEIPIVLVEDSTFTLQQTYNPDYANLLQWSARQGNDIEIAAYHNASALLFCTDWAAQSAIEDYHIDPNKVYTVPFGANLDTSPPKEIALSKKRSYRCTLLFIGNSWDKKGGEIAFETLLALEGLDIEAELIVCGSVPPKKFQHERLRVIPFLNKNDESQRIELERLYRIADFIVVPSRQETYGIAFCEASAYGVPSLTADTGGNAEVVRNGENGFVLPYSARGGAYAEVIAEIYNNDNLYTHLARSSRQVFEERLNWDTWGKAMQHILAEITAYPKILV